MRSYEEKPGIVRGSCFCEAVTFELALPTTSCVHCHCTMCQRANGAGYVTWVAAPKGQFRLTSGDEGLSTYHSSDHGQRPRITVNGHSAAGAAVLCSVS